MNRDPQPENRDPALRYGEVIERATIYEKRCIKCRQKFKTLLTERTLCGECVHKSPEPNNPTE